MDVKIKLIEMTRHEMRLVKITAVIASLLSAILASITVGILSLPSIHGSEEMIVPKATPRWLLYVETALGLSIFLVCLMALLSRIAKARKLEEEENETILIRLQRTTTYLLSGAVLLSIPFGTVAELTQEKNFPNFFFLGWADIANAVGVAIIACYLWTYPFTCGQSREPLHDAGMELEHPKLPVFQIVMCSMYALLRIGFSFVLMIHLKPLPLQNVLVLVGMLLKNEWTQVYAWDAAAIAATSILEIAVIVALARDLRKTADFLESMSSVPSHEIIVALRFFQQSCLILLLNILFIDLVTALVSPSRGNYTVEGTENLVLLQPIGHCAISVAITAYALREYYVLHEWREDGVVAKAWGLLSIVFPGDSSRRPNDLVYRVSDERNPLTEFPVPQKNTFSLETAILLFNMAWLASTYSGEGDNAKEPSDFGRPNYALNAVATHRDGEVGAIILQGVDRAIVAFKPVSADDLKHSYLLALSKTFLGRALAGKCSELDVLKVKTLSSKDNGLLRKCKVHAGFETVYSSLQAQILKELSSLLRQRERPIFITGYGSGGAVATLCALDLSLRCFAGQVYKNSIYTFGAMKSMNSAMVQLYEAHVPFRWRCVVSGDSFSGQPISTSFRHATKVATFTRNGHLAIEYVRTCKWWQSPASIHPMHKLSSYFCALENWHSAFHIKRPIDLWSWPVDEKIQALFKRETLYSESHWPLDSALDSPTPDIESKSVRKLEPYFAASSTEPEVDDVIAFSR